MIKSKTSTKPWSKQEEKLMLKLVRSGAPTSRIAKQLRRSPASIRSKAQKRAISLKARR